MENKEETKANAMGQVISVPTFLFGEEYQHLSADAKILYSLIWNEFRKAENQGRINEQGEPYAEFSAERAKSCMKCGSWKVAKMFRDLEEYELIRREMRPCHMSRFYILKDLV